MVAKKSTKPEEVVEKPKAENLKSEILQNAVDALRAELAQKDERIASLTKLLVWVRENIVSGNPTHVETINRTIS